MISREERERPRLLREKGGIERTAEGHDDKRDNAADRDREKGGWSSGGERRQSEKEIMRNSVLE